MFTGIIEEIGHVKAVKKQTFSQVIVIEASKVLEGTKIGDSIAVNGICLTVTAIGSAYPRPEVAKMNVRGRNLVTGLPKTVEVTSEETEEALKEATSQIVEAVHSVLEKTPPELASDIADRGIVLTGGGSLLSGLEDLIESKTGINTMTAEDPMTAVAIGTGKFIEFLSGYRED